jgi:hypothetical protein
MAEMNSNLEMGPGLEQGVLEFEFWGYFFFKWLMLLCV